MLAYWHVNTYRQYEYVATCRQYWHVNTYRQYEYSCDLSAVRIECTGTGCRSIAGIFGYYGVPGIILLISSRKPTTVNSNIFPYPDFVALVAAVASVFQVGTCK